ncbi:hypothetical protein [Streptomyces sp. NPDC057748]|uniref:hypothetical protein n=1 Tax=unclassified Streptomyces TaxID=2593676 RepID=UPI0036C29002
MTRALTYTTGACAFACLLYILGRRDSALYWWRFAAGAENALAAHVLALYHAANGTGPEARVWCAHSRLLGFTADQHLPRPLHLARAAPPRPRHRKLRANADHVLVVGCLCRVAQGPCYVGVLMYASRSATVCAK